MVIRCKAVTDLGHCAAGRVSCEVFETVLHSFWNKVVSDNFVFPHLSNSVIRIFLVFLPRVSGCIKREMKFRCQCTICCCIKRMELVAEKLTFSVRSRIIKSCNVTFSFHCYTVLYSTIAICCCFCYSRKCFCALAVWSEYPACWWNNGTSALRRL